MNIIAFSDMRKKFRITVDTSKENVIAVHIGEGRVMKLLEIGAGLCIWKPEHNFNLTNKRISSYTFLSLVSTNKSNYTRQELDRVDASKKLYIKLGMPGIRSLSKYWKRT